MDFKGAVFRWDYRKLVDKLLHDQDLPKKKRGRYFMNKCTDPEAGLPTNQTFTKLTCPRIYGDAFIFKVEEPEFSKSGRASQAFMSHPNASRRSPRTREATTLEREKTTVLVERSRKPRSKADSKTRKAKTHGLECRTVLIEPPKKPHSTFNWNKMLFTRKSQPATKAVLARYPPNKDKSGLDVIRIPCDGSGFQVKSIPLIGIGHDGIRFEDCVAAEDWLKQFPDVQSVADKSTFSWKNRSLIGIPAENLGSSVNEMYFMYVCYEVKTGLPHNKYLENLSGVQMFGDGYLFKLFRDFDEDGRPIFLDMGSVSAIDLKNGGVTKECVQKLLDFMTGDVGKAKR